MPISVKVFNEKLRNPWQESITHDLFGFSVSAMLSPAMNNEAETVSTGKIIVDIAHTQVVYKT